MNLNLSIVAMILLFQAKMLEKTLKKMDFAIRN